MPSNAQILAKARALTDADFDRLGMLELAAICQRLGRSGRGSRRELVGRIRTARSKDDPWSINVGGRPRIYQDPDGATYKQIHNANVGKPKP